MHRQCWCQKIQVIKRKSQCQAQDTSLWAIHQGVQRHSTGLPLGHVPCWLAFIVFGGAVQAAGEGKASVAISSPRPCTLQYWKLITVLASLSSAHCVNHSQNHYVSRRRFSTTKLPKNLLCKYLWLSPFKMPAFQVKQADLFVCLF